VYGIIAIVSVDQLYLSSDSPSIATHEQSRSTADTYRAFIHGTDAAINHKEYM
jgi:hypothetical protein